MKKLVLIDGNSILNRAFYGIMNNKMLMTSDGRYTNAVYGFLNIMFKIEEDIKPDYIGVAFDLKSPTKRHELYSEYKGTRKGMPDELAQQLPLIKEVLQAMNIAIIEKEKYEADDILGTLAKKGEKEKLDVTILTGDRDSFQLASDNITIRIPRTKMGKTEVEDFNKEKIIEVYGVNPNQLIDVKGLQGDTSDNIPGVPGVGEKTALNLIKEYKNIENLYKKIEEGNTDLKGTLLEKLSTNKELAELSKTLGTIDVKVPLDIDIDDLQIKTWNDEKVLEIFQELRFNRFIERFNLGQKNNKIKENLKIEIEEINNKEEIEKLIDEIQKNKILFYFLETKENKNEEQKENTKSTQEKVVESPKHTETKKPTQVTNKIDTTKNDTHKEEKPNDIQENKNDDKVQEKTKCTDTEHGVSAGNSNLWFNSYDEAVAYYDNLINTYSNQVHNGEISSEEYYKLCPYGYETWSCPYCGKWTLNYYKR